MEQKQSIGELLAFVRRNLIALIAVTGIGIGLSVAYALSRPPVFETSTKVLIESAQIPDELARSTANMPTAARLQMTEQRLMARDSLAALIDRLDLFADLRALSMARKVELLRNSTHIESISASGNPWGQDAGVVAFTISVALGDAAQAALVANELARNAIDQNLEVRSERAQETLVYFEREERRIAAALAEAEAAISDLRKANDGALPEDLEPNRAALARLETSASDIDRQILELELRRGELQAGLLSGGVAGPSGLTTGENELQRLELELATRRRVLAPNHPTLRRLQEQLDAVRALVASGGATDDGGREDAGALAQRSASRQRQLDQITNRLEQLATRQREVAEQKARLEAALVRNPEVEASRHALERQLEQLREQYADVSRRHVEARTGAQLEANRQSERFEILEPALVPEYPIGPNRKKIVVFGAAVSGGVALGLALLLQMLRPSIYTSTQMERELGLRPIVAIPYVAVPGERRRRILRAAAACLLLVIGLWVTASLLEPEVASVSSLRHWIERRLNVDAVLGGFEAGREPTALNLR